MTFAAPSMSLVFPTESCACTLRANRPGTAGGPMVCVRNCTVSFSDCAMTGDQARLLLRTYQAGGSITVMWRRDGLPARNLVSRGLLEFVERVHLPGPYPSSSGRHVWTYRLTGKGNEQATKLLEPTSSTLTAVNRHSPATMAQD